MISELTKNPSDSQFRHLMIEFGYSKVDQEFVDFLNKQIKKNKLNLFFLIDPLDERPFLKNKEPSITAYIFDVSKVKIDVLDVFIFIGGEISENEFGVSKVFLDDKVFYPAYFNYRPFPERISNNIQMVGIPGGENGHFLPFPIKLSIDDVILTNKDFINFKKNIEIKKSSKKQPKREAVLKAMLLHTDLDLSCTPLPISVHSFPTRLSAWNALTNEDKSLFPIKEKNDDTLNKFFNIQKIIAFK